MLMVAIEAARHKAVEVSVEDMLPVKIPASVLRPKEKNDQRQNVNM